MPDKRASSAKTTKTYRPALLPALLGGTAVLLGLLLLGSEGYLGVRYTVSILALITAVFAVQARAWLWLPPLAAVAVLWNPVLPFEFSGQLWIAGHVLAAGVMLAAGFFIRAAADQRR